MSKSPLLNPDRDIEDLSDEELLKRIASLDPDTYPLVPIAQEVLDRQEGSS